MANRRVSAGLVCWPRPATRYSKTAIIGAAASACLWRLLQYPARRAGKTPMASAADGRGMILIEKRVDL